MEEIYTQGKKKGKKFDFWPNPYSNYSKAIFTLYLNKNSFSLPSETPLTLVWQKTKLFSGPLLLGIKEYIVKIMVTN